jgi:hypothetical protein
MGGWSTTAIGKFYNGRDHSTVCHAITRIEFLRRSDQGVTAIIDGLAHACEQEEALASNGSGHLARLHRLDPVLGKTGSGFIDQLANGIAAPVLARLDSKERTRAILRREDETGSSAKAFYANGDGKAGVTTKKALHQLVDELPDEQAELARQFLEDLRQASGGEGPPLDSGTLASLDRGLADISAGRMKPLDDTSLSAVVTYSGEVVAAAVSYSWIEGADTWRYPLNGTCARQHRIERNIASALRRQPRYSVILLRTSSTTQGIRQVSLVRSLSADRPEADFCWYASERCS